jgi:trehalose-phosphatase
MAEYLFESSTMNRVIESLRMKPGIFAFDFDGTLTPIADTPEAVVIPAKLPYLLEKLAEDKKTIVAIVSGRTIADLKRMIGIPSIIYFGNHGITSSFEGFGSDKEDLHNWTNEALKIYERVLFFETNYKGCLIENKGPVISIHYRNVEPGKVGELLLKIKSIVEEYNFNIQNGKKVIELKPKTHFSKGIALSELAAKSFFGWRVGDPFLFAGDDYTDEDGFRVMKNFGKKSFGFKIGQGETAADYRLSDGEILKLIEIIVQEEL